MDKNKLNDDSKIVIQDQHFLTENSLGLAPYSAKNFFPRISFVNCNFEKVQLPGVVFGSCSFQNCIFNDFFTRKAVFSGCRFEDCKIINSCMRRGDFYKTHFQNCEFLGVDLSSSDMDSCTLKETKFLQSNLQFIAVDNVKVWKSNKWVKIGDWSSFEKHLDVIQPNKETAGCVDLDFEVKGPPPLTHVNVKILVGSEVLRRQNQTISLENMAYRMGKKIVFEKHRFIGIENGPATFKSVGHRIDLGYVPVNEKSIVRERILEGADKAGSKEGISFINDN